MPLVSTNPHRRYHRAPAAVAATGAQRLVPLGQPSNERISATRGSRPPPLGDRGYRYADSPKLWLEEQGAAQGRRRRLIMRRRGERANILGREA
jgi:hypothetical protein